MMNQKTSKRAPPPPDDETKNANEILEGAPEILHNVGKAYIFAFFPAREIPTFSRSELKYGPVLGVGGFGVVKEIHRIKLQAASLPTLKEDIDDKDEAAIISAAAQDSAAMDDEFYDISIARGLMAKRCLRDGDSRYAVKYLHPDLSPTERARGVIDLAIEAKYLSVVAHPNIIKMRGWAEGDPLKGGFFLVLDRLYETLEQRMEVWKKVKKGAKGIPIFSFGTDRATLDELMMDRLLVVYDLASAFRYLHQHKLVYRDIKPDNCGFDVRGDIKLFDFGLCKSLHPELKAEETGMYNLTGCTGSLPYMAPEVARCLPYNCTADIFSFGIMTWEIFALKPAFPRNMTLREFYNRVSIEGERPRINKKWPHLTCQIIQDAWSTNPKDRPTFNRISDLVRSDLKDMSVADEVVHRTMHMDRRSRYSIAFRGDDIAIPEKHIVEVNDKPVVSTYEA